MEEGFDGGGDDLQDQAFAVLSSNDTRPMEALFSLLFSGTEPQRSEAHRRLLSFKDHHPSLLFIKLLYLIRFSTSVDLRVNSARVLQGLEVQNFWSKLSPLCQSNLKVQFLECLHGENSLHILRILCGVVAEIASEIFKGNDQWPELLDFLVRSVAMENERSQVIALLVFAYMPQDCRKQICNELLPQTDMLYVGLLHALSATNVHVKVAGFWAAISLIYLFSGPLVRDWLGNLLRTMMVCVIGLLETRQEEYAQMALEELVKLVKSEPLTLKPYLNNLILDMLKIAESRTFKDGSKYTALQFLMGLLQVQDFALTLQVLPYDSKIGLFIIPMRMLLGIQGDDAWYEMGSEEGENAGKTETYNYGIECLNRMPFAIGRQSTVSIAFRLLPTYMEAEEWQRRHAGVTMLGVLSNECSDEMIMTEDCLEKAVTTILTSFQDSHPRVRWAAFNVMQLPTDLVGTIQILHYRRILPAMIATLDEKQNPRVKEKVASGLLLFVKSFYQDCLTMYMNLDAVLKKLIRVLQDNKETTKGRATVFCTFNAIAEQCPNACQKFSADYLPLLLEACTDKNSEVKREAVIGIRITAEFGGSQFKPFIKRVLSNLSTVIGHPRPSYPEDIKAFDIAVSALGKLCEFHRDIINAPKLLATWLSLLPLKDDLPEAKVVHEQLCFMVERSDYDLFGQNWENLPIIIRVFLDVISQGSNLATEQTARRMIDLLKQMWQRLPRARLGPIYLSLNPQQRQILANEVLL